MYEGSESDEGTLLDLMFNAGKYDWLKDTARVIRAVQARYGDKTRGKAFTALFQLCEVKCGAYLAESCFDEEYKAAKMVYIDMQKNPNQAPPTDTSHVMAVVGCVLTGLMGLIVSPGAALAVAAGFSVAARARLFKQQAHVALDAGDYGEARALMLAAESLERDGFTDVDEKPPPLLEDITATAEAVPQQRVEGEVDQNGVGLLVKVTGMSEARCYRLLQRWLHPEALAAGCDSDDGASSDSGDDAVLEMAIVEAWGASSDGAEPTPTVATESNPACADTSSEMVIDTSSDTDEPRTDRDYGDGCPQKPYDGRAPTTEERREWEAAATRYYQSLLRKYQGAIETVRLDVFEFLSQDNLDISKFLDRKSSLAKKTGLKGGLDKTRAYFALASLYGDVGGSYEPERLDWYRAQFVTELPEPLPAKCMFVHVTEAAVTMVLRDGNKNGQDVNQDLTATAPRLAEMLQLWMPHAASAQPDNAHPFVFFKQENDGYGKSYDNSGAYGKLVKRAWKVAGVNPQEDAAKEWASNDRHGLGCGWARTITGRARRGVVCREGEQRDDAAAAAQGHSATTERASYRAL
jgi:hypothetical protein